MSEREPDARSIEEASTDSTQHSYRNQCETLVGSFTAGDVQPLADALHEDVKSDLGNLLSPELPGEVFADSVETLERLQDAIVAQSGELQSAGVEEVGVEEGGWEQHNHCGKQTANSRWETTIQCRRGTHHLGIGFENQQVVEVVFLDEYSPPSSVNQDSFTATEVTFENEGLEIGGTLTVPSEADTTGCVVLVHGAGEADRNFDVGAQQFLKDLAWGLAEQGIASYRYDKRSYLTELDPSKMGLDWPVVDDAVAATETIADHPEIDDEHIFLAGHSRGGMSAPRIAQQYGEYGGVLVLEGYAQSFPEYIVDVLSEQKQFERTTGGEYEAVSEHLSKMRSAVESGDLSKVEEVMGIPESYLREVAEYDKTGIVESLDTPFMLLQAGGDLPEFKQASAEMWREVLNQPSSEVVYFENLNHYLQRCHGPSVGVEFQLFHDNVDADVFNLITEWVIELS